MSADPLDGLPLGGGGGRGSSRSSRSPLPPTTFTQHQSSPSTTTISTIVLNSKPIQLVIALLQVRANPLKSLHMDRFQRGGT